MKYNLNSIKKQAKIWNRLAFIIPMVFISGSAGLYYLNLIGERNIFLVVLIGWSIIAISWWFWTMITITFLARMMIKSNKDLIDIKDEVKKVREEIS
jgi:hypothetical protein